MTTLLIIIYIICGILSSLLLYNTIKKSFYEEVKMDIKEEIKNNFSFKCAFIVHWIFSLLTGWYGLLITMFIVTFNIDHKYITFYYRIPKNNN